MPTDDSQLDTILQAKQKQESSSNVTSQVVAEIKSSLMFQISWCDLLQPGPTSMSTLGACLVASASPNAVLDLDPPTGGFKYIQHQSVKANLVECGNLGRFAFLEAQKGMDVVQRTGVSLNSKMADVIQIIADPMTAQRALKPQLEFIESEAAVCLDAVMAIDKKLEEWLLYACELHAACVAKDPSTQEANLSSEVCIATEQCRLEGQKATVDQAKEASDLLEKQMSMTSDAFKQASGKFPPGWDLMGQQVVEDLAHSATTALDAAIPALVDKLNPMKKLKAGDVVGGFVHLASGSGTAVPEPPPRPNVVPPNATDPAIAEVLKIITYLAALNAILYGKNDDVDWEKAKGDIKFLKDIFNDHLQQFRTLTTGVEPSLTLLKVFETTSQIATEVTDNVSKSAQPNFSFPDKTSATVKKWQSDFTEQFSKANTLAATARSLPGTAAGGTPMMAGPAEAAHTNAQTIQAQAVLESAKSRLTTTQQMLETSRANYVKTIDLLQQQQNSLTKIQATLNKLTTSSLSLKEIKAILIEAIRPMISLKQEITNWVCFFNALPVLIQVVTKNHVQPFLDTVQALVTGGSTESDKYKIGPYTLTDLQRTHVYNAMLTIRSYFGVFADNAKAWNTFSLDNIMPGLQMVDKCSESAGQSGEAAASALKETMHSLQDWSAKATKAVADLASQSQEEVMKGMDSRMDAVKEITKQIDPPKASTAIIAGTSVNKLAGTKYIEDKKKQNGLMRFTSIDG